MKLMDFLPRNMNTNKNRPLPVVMVIISLHVRVVFANDFKFKLIENKSVVLSWVYLQPFCSTTKNTSVNEFVNKPSINLTVNAMKLIDKLLEKDVELFWGYLYPFCSTFFTFFTLFLIFNFNFFTGTKKTNGRSCRNHF